MRQDIPNILIDDSKKTTRKIDLDAFVDWNANRTFESEESIKDYILSLTIDRKLEGNNKLGISTVDRATITVDNSEGHFSPKNINSKWTDESTSSLNVLPTRKAKIKATINDNDYVNIFSGIVKSIKPNFNDSKVSLTIDDEINLLQNIDCPDKFYYNESPEDIIKDWLDNIDYGISYIDKNGDMVRQILHEDINGETIDDTFFVVNKNFNGKTMWEGIMELAESVWGRVYTNNGVLYFKTDLSPSTSSDEAVEVFATDDRGGNENVFSISETYTSDKLYNEIEIVSNPYTVQPKQVIWTGAENISEIQEEYNSDDIDTDNKSLQLTYVPDGETTEEPTNNVPIVPNSTSILDTTTGIEYTESDGISSIDYDNGVIYFSDTQDYPMPSSGVFLKVKYSYYFNKIVPNKTRHFFVDLDNPAIDITSISDNLKAEDEDGNDITDEISTTQEVQDNLNRIEISLTNNSTEKATLYSDLNGNQYSNLILKGKPLKQNKEIRIVEVDQDSIDAYKGRFRLTIQNDLINSEKRLRRIAQYLLWKYSTPKSKLKIETKGMFHLELGDRVQVVQEERDIDTHFIIKGIRDKFSDGCWDSELELEQAEPSAWEYNEKGTPVINARKESSEFDLEPPVDVTGFSVSLDGVSKTGTNRVKLTWDENKEVDLKEYYIYRKLNSESNWMFLKAVKKGTTEYIDTSIIYQGLYDYTITAVDRSDNQSSLTTSSVRTKYIRDTSAPETPNWWFEPAIGQYRSIKLEWTANNEDDMSHYEIWRTSDAPSDDSRSWRKVDNVPHPQTTFVDEGLDDETTYYYKLEAVDVNDNDSDRTNQEASATTILIDNSGISNSVFQVDVTCNPVQSEGSVSNLWDGREDTGITFDELNSENEIVVTFEYPTEYFLDSFNIMTSVGCYYYVQAFMSSTQSWVNLKGTSASMEFLEGGQLETIKFDKGIVSKKIRFITDIELTIYELEFKKTLRANEIIVENNRTIKEYTDEKSKNTIGKPENSHLFHFDMSAISTSGIEPDGNPTFNLREDLSKFGGSMAIEFGTLNYSSYDPFEDKIIDTTDDSNNNLANFPDIGVDVGEILSVQIKVKNNSNYSGRIDIRGYGVDDNDLGLTQGSDGNILEYYKIKTNGERVDDDWSVESNQGWTKYILRYEVTEVPSSSNNFDWIIEPYDFSGGSLVSREFQCEIQDYPTSVVDGERTGGWWQINKNDLLPIEKDFTVAMWVAPTGNAINGSDYKFLSLGWKPDSRLYIWNHTPIDSSDNIKLVAEFGDDDSGNRQYTNLTSNTPFEIGKFEFFVVSFDYDKKEYKFYRGRDGNLELMKIKTVNKVHPIQYLKFENSNWFYDELLVSPKCHDEFEIKRWFESNSPFLDSDKAIGAGENSIKIDNKGIKYYNPN
ncbi:MAG: fibronectin type III domain-containing protein, partial [bacterium]